MTPEHLPVELYEQQLAEKVRRLTTMMQVFTAPPVDVFRSPSSHYRMRAEFRIWHQGEDLYHIIFDQQTRQRIRVDKFPAACELINHMMPLVIDAVRDNHDLRYKLFQIDYLATTSEQIVISLLYHRRLDDSWQQAAAKLRDHFRQNGINISFIGRATKTKIVLGQDYVDETLLVNGKPIIYRQVENSFSQPNAAINVHMLEWALSVTAGSSGDLLELYCGNGNFSIALASNFRKVLATEIAKPSVGSAQYNIDVNRAENVQIIRMSAEELTQAIKGQRQFNRLQGIDLDSYQCNTIFVDPPRNGLDPDTLQLVSSYPVILYISCNPDTLCHNLQTLSATHNISKLALFDQFPYTQHMECGVLLTHKNMS